MWDSGQVRRGRVLLCGLAAQGFLLVAVRVWAEPVPCTEVLAELNRRVSRGMSRDVGRIANILKADPDWVEQCLRLNGRRVERSANLTRPEEEPTELVEPVFDPNDMEPEPELRPRIKKIR